MSYTELAHIFRTMRALEDAHAALGQRLTQEREHAGAEAADRRAAEDRARRVEEQAHELRTRLAEAQASAVAERERAEVFARAEAERADWPRWRRLRWALRRG